MSVGYDLEGIKTAKVDNFIEGLKDAGKNKSFHKYKSILREEIKKGRLFDIIQKIGYISDNELSNCIENISPNISNSITLSTMHGCPPEEIEAICKYLIKEKKLHTFVKLNPTLLGYDTVKNILSKLGYNYIQLNKDSFASDLQYPDAITMLKRLEKYARNHNKTFGVKLSNTLAVNNNKKLLSGKEMYMSGRALFPITINLASKLASEFDGDIDISYSGGASFFNISQIFETGIKPITLATDLLKPGSYLRLRQIAEKLEPYLEKAKEEGIDEKRLKELAEKSLTDSNYFKSKRYTNNLKIDKDLPLFDCFIAPCVESCPIKQDIPEYIRLIGEKRYSEAFELIISKNPLPYITGFICDQKCRLKCSRWDYEEPLLIRDLKRVAAERGYEDFIKKSYKNAAEDGVKIAIIGAGPSGLSAGYFLAKAGFDIIIFDKRDKPGGTVQYVIPNFRLPCGAIDNDMNLIKKMGVKFQFGIDENFSIEKFKKEGYKYIYLAIGAGKSNTLQIAEDNKKIYDAIEFLEKFNNEKNDIYLGKHVAVIGGGNSAMDSARAALRIKGVKRVYIIYRRTKEYMPADKEELDNALDEGVIFKELLSPYKFEKENILICQKMKLGEFASDGRRKPVPIENEFEEIYVDSVVSAIGERVDTEILKKNEVNIKGKNIEVNPVTNETSIENVFIGGDALRGPSTVVEAIADGKKVADAIIKKEEIVEKSEPFSSKVKYNKEKRISEIIMKRGNLQPAENELVTQKKIEREAGRCLECNFICSKCVEVCPNRANIAIEISHEFSPLDSIQLDSEHLTGQARTNTNSNFKNIYQIIHIDGMCNECGNCATFCPYESDKPYKDKLTLFWKEEDFNNSKNNGFILENEMNGPIFKVRLNSNIFIIHYDKHGKILSKGLKHKLENTRRYNKTIKLIWVVYQDYKYLLS
jgi:putative selenate reductase